jgi:hypothetical protein
LPSSLDLPPFLAPSLGAMPVGGAALTFAPLAAAPALKRRGRQRQLAREGTHGTQTPMDLPLEDDAAGQIELKVSSFQLENQTVVNQAPGRARHAAYRARNGIIVGLLAGSLDILWRDLQSHTSPPSGNIKFLRTALQTSGFLTVYRACCHATVPCRGTAVPTHQRIIAYHRASSRLIAGCLF